MGQTRSIPSIGHKNIVARVQKSPGEQFAQKHAEVDPEMGAA